MERNNINYYTRKIFSIDGENILLNYTIQFLVDVVYLVIQNRMKLATSQMEKMEAALRTLISNKVARVDEITPEMLKSLNCSGIQWLTRVFHVASRKRVVTPIFKRRSRGNIPTTTRLGC
jgi:hypothetical protein